MILFPSSHYKIKSYQVLFQETEEINKQIMKKILFLTSVSMVENLPKKYEMLLNLQTFTVL